MFGISFGANKSNSKQDTVANKNETTSQNQSTNTQGTNTSSSNTSGSQNQNSQGQTTTGQQSSQNTSGSQNQKSSTTGSSFSEQILSQLEAALSRNLGTYGGSNASETANAKVGNFDSEKYIADTVNAARTRTDSSLEESLGSLFSNVGGTGSTNSAAALLQGRMVNDANASIAGVQAEATANAAKIQQQNASTLASIDSAKNQSTTQLADALKGGRTVQNTDAVTQMIQNLLSGTSGQTNVNESSNQNTQQSTQATEIISQLVNALMNGTTQTNATESTRGQNVKFGGGISAGI